MLIMSIFLPPLYCGASSLILALTFWPMPPSLAWPYMSFSPPMNTISPPAGMAPSLTMQTA